MKKLKIKKRKGFSLLELLVSLLIISSAVVTILPNVRNSVLMSKKAKSLVTVAQLAKNKLAEIQLEEKIKEGKKDGKFDDFEGCFWKWEIKKVEINDVFLYQEEGHEAPKGMKLDRLFKIELTISYDSRGEEINYETTSFLFSEK